jgi:HEPN domain-containing protein
MQTNTQLQKFLHLIQLNDAPEAVFIIATATIKYNYNNIFFTADQTTEQPNAYLLLVVLAADAKQCTRSQCELENVLQTVAAVTVWCMPLQTFNEQLLTSGYFACTVYKSAERLFIEKDAGIVPPPVTPVFNKYQNQWYQRAAEFYAGAELFIIRKQYTLAAFHLHQCAEQCFTSVVYNKCGYRPATHNLLLLYRYACWFEPSLHELFTHHSCVFVGQRPTMATTRPAMATTQPTMAATQPTMATEDSLLHLLQKAYTGSRYTNDYSIKGKQLEMIKEKIEILLEKARTVEELTVDIER